MALASPRFQLRLLGPVQIEHDGQPVAKLGSQKSLALLAYLIRNPHEQSRAKLAALFWIDQPQATARSNLRWALNNLSNLLPGAIEATRQTLRIRPNAPIWIDLHHFDALTAAFRNNTGAPDALGLLTQAFELYRGDFLEGLTIDEAPDLELWLLQERDFWRRQVMTMLEQLIAGHRAANQSYHALRFANQLLALEPWREESHRQLMELLAEGGQRAAALTQFTRCCQILASELAVEPSPATVALYEQIRDNNEAASLLLPSAIAPQSTSAVSTNRAPLLPTLLARADWGEAPVVHEFYGREAESAQLEAWLGTDAARLIVVLGMGGMGKTTLVTHVARRLAEQFDRVIWRSLSNTPAVGEMIYTWVQNLSPQQSPTWPEHFEEQIHLLLRHLQMQRTLLILDNLESLLQGNERAGSYRAGDAGYGQLLQALATGTHRSTLILTSREQPHGVGHLAEHGGAVRILHLRGLDLNAGRTLLNERGLADSLATEVALVMRASGNPLALKVIAQTICDLFRGEIGTFLSDETFIFDDLRDMLDQQFQRLSPLEQGILLWLAIEWQEIDQGDLLALLTPPAPRHTFLEALRSLERRSLIEINPTGISAPTVVMEHAISFLVTTICQEIRQRTPHFLKSHALYKALAKEYVRQTQSRLIIQPILEQLENTLGQVQLENRLRHLLKQLRNERLLEHSDRFSSDSPIADQFPLLPLALAAPPARGSYSGGHYSGGHYSGGHYNGGHYGGGNILHLLLALETDLIGWDFSYLPIWQAYLRNRTLSHCDFRYADFAQSSFTDAFGLVHAVAFHPSGQELAATAAHEIRFWRDPDGQCTAALRGHTDDVWSIAFDPDGTTLVSGSWDQSVRLWDLATQKVIRTLLGHTKGVTSVAVSPDGLTIASGSYDQTIRLWDLQDGRCRHLLRGHTEWVWGVAFSPDGGLLASASGDCTVRLWQVRTGEVLTVLDSYNDQCWAVAFSPDGRYLASGGNDGLVLIWDIRSRTISHILRGHSGWVRSLAYTPDGSVLVSGSNDGTIRLWSASTGQPLQTLRGHRNAINSVAVSHSGRYLASASNDQSVRLWEILSGQVVQIIHGYTNWVRSVAFAVDGRGLLSGSDDGQARLWTVDPHPTSRAHGGETVASLLDVSAARGVVVTQPTTLFVGHSQMVRHVALNADGTKLATASADRTIRLWDVATGKVLYTLRGHTNWISCVAWGGQAAPARVATRVDTTSWLLSSSWDGTIALWNSEEGRLLRTLHGHGRPVGSALFHPAGHLIVSGGADKLIRFWETTTGAPVGVLRGHTDDLRSLAFSTDGRWLVSGSADGTVRLWEEREREGQTGAGETAPYRLVRVWIEPRQDVRSVTIRADGRWVAAGGDAGIISLWDRETGHCVQELRGHSMVIWSVAFSPDGSLLASGGSDAMIKLWHGASGACLQTFALPGPYQGMNIAHATGLTMAQRETLKLLGAVEEEKALSARAATVPSSMRLVATALPHNLPRERTPLIGRQEELTQLRELLLTGSRPLVTLVGEGGVGKSRLALAMAEILVTRAPENRPTVRPIKFPDGVWFVPLVSIDAQSAMEQALVTAIADAVHLRFAGAQAPLEQLIDFLRRKELLLILDNMEHLVEGALLLSEILTETPGVQMLVTSRTPLNLQEEWRYGVQGLALPEPLAESIDERTLSALRHNSTVALFSQAAQRVDQTFTVTVENQRAVVAICRYVHGLPLALELAASVLAQMSCQALAAELIETPLGALPQTPSLQPQGTRALDLLQTSLRNVPARHRNLRNLFAYSWQLLTLQEQQAVMQLAIFRGGGEQAALVAITGHPLSVLAALITQSLVQRGDEGRYTMHELLRQFCLEQLALSADATLAPQTRQRHAAYYLQMLYEAEATLKGDAPQPLLIRLRRDLDNLRQAWQWALQSADWPLLAQSLMGLSRFYLLTGLLNEGHHTMSESYTLLRQQSGNPMADGVTLAEDPAPRLLPYRLLNLLLIEKANFCNARADYDGAVAAALLVLSQAAADPQSRAAAHLRWGEALWYKGEIEPAEPQLTAALDLLPDEPAVAEPMNLEIRADALCFLGLIAVRKGQYATATALYHQSHQLSVDLSDAYRTGRALYSLGTAYRNQAQYTEAQRYLAQGLTIARQTGDRHSESRGLNSLGDIELYQGNYTAAREHYTHVAHFAVSVGDRRSECIAQTNLGIVARDLGQSEAATRYFTESLALARAIGFPRGEGWNLCSLSLLCHQTAQPQRAWQLAEEALTLFNELGDRLGQAFAQTNLGRAHAAVASWEAATRAYELALALRQTLGQPHLAIEVRAGLAAVAWGRGDRAKAVAHVEAVLTYLTKGTLAGVEAPGTVYATCYQILCDAADEQAPAFLADAQNFLQRRANLMDEADRALFLQRVATLWRTAICTHL